MARPLRIEFPGAVYHVTSRINARQDIVADDRDRMQWLAVPAWDQKVRKAVTILDKAFKIPMDCPMNDLRPRWVILTL